MAKRDLQRRMDTSGATVSNAAITITTSSAGGGTGMIAHDLFGPYHTGNLDRTQAPWVATDIATAIATHTAIADAHHTKLHSIIDPAHHNVSGAQYSVVGLSAANVLGMIRGRETPDRWLVISAHYDHLGVVEGKVYPGADDNASGSVAVMIG